MDRIASAFHYEKNRRVPRLSLAPAFAQVANTGSISGLILDAGGAAVPATRLQVTNRWTQVARTAVSNEAGFSAFESLLAGSYAIAVTKPGFQSTIVSDVILAASQRLQTNVMLQVRAVESKINLAASPLQVETQSGAGNVGQVASALARAFWNLL